MEGKEVASHFQFRFVRHDYDDASCGAVNSMHIRSPRWAVFVPLFNIQLGEIIIGGVGAGLYGMLVFVVLAVFIAGLMVGGLRNISARKSSRSSEMAMLALLVLAVSILGSPPASVSNGGWIV